jgi:spore germination protein KB
LKGQPGHAKANRNCKPGNLYSLLFLFGSSVVMGVSAETPGLLDFPFHGFFDGYSRLFALARIMRLYHERDLYEIMELIVRQNSGQDFYLIFCWYALHLCALVLRIIPSS